MAGSDDPRDGFAVTTMQFISAKPFSLLSRAYFLSRHPLVQPEQTAENKCLSYIPDTRTR